jgi:hypothetical protein
VDGFWAVILYVSFAGLSRSLHVRSALFSESSLDLLLLLAMPVDLILRMRYLKVL